jgi:hypothetical protein
MTLLQGEIATKRARITDGNGDSGEFAFSRPGYRIMNDAAARDARDAAQPQAEIVRGLGKRNASLFDQPHRLKLELACKLPPFHDSPPVPSKHLTRCLRNRVQAKRGGFFHAMSVLTRSHYWAMILRASGCELKIRLRSSGYV